MFRTLLPLALALAVATGVHGAAQNCTVTSDGVITGWDAASSKCVPCASKPCIDCRDNYEVCKACAAQGASQQSEAEAPFYLSKNATCEFCDFDGSKGCNMTQGCNADGTCIACSDNFRLIGGKCVMCADGCNYVYNAQGCDAQGRCAVCDQGWTKAANGSCLQCPDFCDECDVGPDGAVPPMLCLACNNGYTLSGDGTACKPCDDPNCYQCPEGPAVCANCTLFMLPSGKCAEESGIENCSNTDASGKCTQCFSGYALVGDKCEECAAGEGCESCPAANVKECSECNAEMGFILDPATKKCISKCKDTWCDECASPTAAQCEKCSSGFGLSSAGKCEQCLVNNCSQCDGDISKCQACFWNKRGFNALVDGTCVFFSNIDMEEWAKEAGVTGTS